MVSKRRGVAIVFLFAFINIAFFIYIKRKMERTLTHVPDQHVDNMYTLFKFMVEFFDRHDITYWAIGGTLIGALRNCPPGPIRWDDDLDVGILGRDKNKLVRAMKTDAEFKKRVEYKRVNFGYQFRLKGTASSYKDYYLDIFIFKKQMGPFGEKYYIGEQDICFADHHYNTLSEILPVKKQKFWDFMMSVPNDLTTVHRGYDEDVLKYGVVYNHAEKGSKLDLTENVNSCNLIPTLSKKLIQKLQFA